jgi:uncharacterized protein YraI
LTLAIIKPQRYVVELWNGPGREYEAVNLIGVGQTLEIVGRNADSSWWQVLYQTVPLWVAGDEVKAFGPIDKIQVIEPPATPTVPPNSTPTHPVLTSPILPTATIDAPAP